MVRPTLRVPAALLVVIVRRCWVVGLVVVVVVVKEKGKGRGRSKVVRGVVEVGVVARMGKEWMLVAVENEGEKEERRPRNEERCRSMVD